MALVPVQRDDSTALGRRGMNRAMPERRWRINRLGRSLFEIAVDDGDGFRPATTEEVDTALRQRELFGAAESPVDRTGEQTPAGRSRGR